MSLTRRAHSHVYLFLAFCCFLTWQHLPRGRGWWCNACVWAAEGAAGQDQPSRATSSFNKWNTEILEQFFACFGVFKVFLLLLSSVSFQRDVFKPFVLNCWSSWRSRMMLRQEVTHLWQELTADVSNCDVCSRLQERDVHWPLSHRTDRHWRHSRSAGNPDYTLRTKHQPAVSRSVCQSVSTSSDDVRPFNTEPRSEFIFNDKKRLKKERKIKSNHQKENQKSLVDF